MKRISIFFGMLTATIVFSGCDKITDPLLPKQQNSSLPNTPPTYRDSSAASGANSYLLYKVLLEDCGGQRCVNCPAADVMADTLISSYNNPIYGRVVMMEDNMGDLAKPLNNVTPYPSYAFSTDYRSIAGNTWCGNATIFNPPGWPAGYINRVGYKGTSIPSTQIGNWQSAIQNLISQNPTLSPVTINIHDSCWVPNRIIGVQFQVTFNTSLSGSYLLETLIIEDHIIDWQIDQSTYGADSTFLHRNVLRGAFGNNSGGLPWGDTIPTTITSSAGKWTSYQTYDFTKGENGKAATWNMANCYIVAFVYNSPNNATPYQVVQAEMIKVE